MSRRNRQERKRRTRAHVIADLSANHVEKQALLCGFTAERVRFDYGIDLVVQTFDRQGNVEGSRILFQLKATDRIAALAQTDTIALRIEQADLVHWLEEPLPVVLVLYDAGNDTGYWLYVQSYFASRPDSAALQGRGRVTVAIPRSNLLNRKAMQALARAKNAVARHYRRSWTHGI